MTSSHQMSLKEQNKKRHKTKRGEITCAISPLLVDTKENYLLAFISCLFFTTIDKRIEAVSSETITPSEVKLEI